MMRSFSRAEHVNAVSEAFMTLLTLAILPKHEELIFIRIHRS